jgi:hypothetical protein
LKSGFGETSKFWILLVELWVRHKVIEGVEEKWEGWPRLRFLEAVKNDLGELQVNGCKEQTIRMDTCRKGGTRESRDE